jgi:tetratricopeptide (TPR) repeat protein
MLLYDLVFFGSEESRKRRLLALLPFIIGMLIIPFELFGSELGLSVNRAMIGESVRVHQLEDLANLSSYSYLLTQFRVVVTYLRLLVLPVNQNFDYDLSLFDSFWHVEVIVSFLFLFFIMVSSVYLLLRSRKNENALGLLAASGAIWFFITLSIESSVIPIYDLIFEHRLYLPSVGALAAFCSVIFLGVDRLRESYLPRFSIVTLTVIFCILTVVPLSVASRARNRVWRNPVVFYEDIVKKSPGKERGHNNLGNAYYEVGLIDDAMNEYKTAIKINPATEKGYQNLAKIYYYSGQYVAAVKELKLAVMKSPESSKTHNLLGMSYQNLERYDDAVQEYKKALTLDRGFADAYFNLGSAYHALGSLNRAVTEYETAIYYDPGNTGAHNNLGAIFLKTGRINDAIEAYIKVIKIDPDKAETYYNLGNAYRAVGKRDEAVAAYRKFVDIAPEGFVRQKIRAISLIKQMDAEPAG